MRRTPLKSRRHRDTGPTRDTRTALAGRSGGRQPDFHHLARIVFELSGGLVHVREADTQSDQFALVFSSDPITAERATEVYGQRLQVLLDAYEVES